MAPRTRKDEMGAELLFFCVLNELAITNTHFEKKQIHKQTWQHPGNKKMHCIDYMIMRQSQQRVCDDMAIVSSAVVSLARPTQGGEGLVTLIYPTCASLPEKIRQVKCLLSG